jgi:ribonuclease HII
VSIIAGVDEAGRGPLAGPVTAGAVVLDPMYPIVGLTDSKKLSPAARVALAEQIEAHAAGWAVVHVSVGEIDALNILNASMLAMQRAVAALPQAPDLLLVDGNRCPQVPCEARAIIKGDLLEPCISAASIVAKVHRDRLMVELDAQFPEYGLRQHKGYPTRAHLEALAVHGPSAVHRVTFAPVRRVMAR